jgi:hypothetical protein
MNARLLPLLAPTGPAAEHGAQHERHAVRHHLHQAPAQPPASLRLLPLDFVHDGSSTAAG